MSQDELYYDALTNLAERVAGGLQNRSQPLDALSQALSQLQNSHAIQGKAADNMKAYITEVHTTLVQTLELALNNYQMALGKYVNGYLEVDSNPNFQLVREDLEAHQRNLTAHRSDFTSLADQLTAISDEAEDIVWLGGAGGPRLNNVADEMDVMKHMASTLMERWNAYEQTDPGFAQVQELLARTRDLIQSTLSVPRGYAYSPGSFSHLMSPAFLSAVEANAAYAMDAKNQKEFSDDWNSITKDYSADQKRIAAAAAKKKAQEEGLWGLVTDVLQTVAGAVITAVGLGLTPFTGGLSLGLVALGGMMVVGGINSGINHFSMAVSGKGLNLIGMATENVGSWYNGAAGKALGQRGVGGFVNGVLSGVGETVSGMAQLSVYDTGKSIITLAMSGQARSEFSDGVSSWWHELSSGNVFVAGQTTAVVASLFVGGESATVAKADEATSLVSKLGRLETVVSSKGASLLDRVSGFSGKLAESLDHVPGVVVREVRTTAGGAMNLLDKGMFSETKLGGKVQQAFSNLESKTSELSEKMQNLTAKGSQSIDIEQAQKVLQDALDNVPKVEYLPGKNPEDILSVPGGKRKPVEDYLSSDYIASHNQLFDGGVTAFSQDDYYLKGGSGVFGRDDGAFVFPKDYAQKMIDASDGNPRELERLLGLDEGSLGDSPIRVDVTSDNVKNLRIPNGNEMGSKDNVQWRPGGYTYPGGVPESVIDQVPQGEFSYKGAFE